MNWLNFPAFFPNFHFWKEDWGMPAIFPNFLYSWILSCLVIHDSYISYIGLLLTITYFSFTCGKGKQWKKTKKCQNIFQSVESLALCCCYNFFKDDVIRSYQVTFFSVTFYSEYFIPPILYYSLHANGSDPFPRS